MSRWNGSAKLVKVTKTKDDEGVIKDTKSYSPVYVNMRHMGMQSWSAARLAGLQADASVELATIDYDGQTRLLMSDKEYDVESVYTDGDYTTLTLAKEVHDD